MFVYSIECKEEIFRRSASAKRDKHFRHIRHTHTVHSTKILDLLVVYLHIFKAHIKRVEHPLTAANDLADARIFMPQNDAVNINHT